MGARKGQNKDSVSIRVLHHIFLNLGYETAVSRTLRECGIDDIDINSILVRAGLKKRGSQPEMGKYNRMMTIKEFIRKIEEEYSDERTDDKQ